MEFVRRPASESPILSRMLSDAETEDDLARAMSYAAKVDEFNRTGEVTLTTLEYQGPDLSPGSDRENSMKGVPRRTMVRIFDVETGEFVGRKATVLSPTNYEGEK